MQGLGDLFKLQNGRPDLFVFNVVERSFADPAFFGKPNERHAPVFSHVPHQNVHSLSPLALSCQRNPRFGLFGDHHSRFVITYHKTPCVQSGRRRECTHADVSGKKLICVRRLHKEERFSLNRFGGVGGAAGGLADAGSAPPLGDGRQNRRPETAGLRA